MFTFDRVSEALYEGAAAARRVTVPEGTEPTAEALGLQAVEVDGQVAAVNHALLRDGKGAISAATSDYVDLSWAPMDGASTYAIVRDEELVATTSATSFRYEDVVPGDSLQFRITAMTVEEADVFTPTYGLEVDVPEPRSNQRTAAESQSEATAAAAVYYDVSELNWYTFIPEARVDAPPVGVPGVGCEYKSGYQFGGDGRDFANSPFYPDMGTSRTQLGAWVSWSRGASLGGPFEQQGLYLGPTTVYDKATGEEVDRRQLSTSEATGEAKVLGIEEGYRTWIDIRMNLQAGNPFCEGNSIAGAFTFTMTRTGNWAIISGSHRQMPSHEIIMSRWAPSGPAVHTPIYRRSYANPLCLISWACPETQMSGYQGTY